MSTSDEERCDLRSMAQRVTEPFEHFEFDASMIASWARVDQLVETFPQELMPGVRQRESGSDKTYRVDHLTVFDGGSWLISPDRFRPAWRRLLTYLAGGRYADDVKALLGLGRTGMDIEVRLSSYPSGGWMTRHTDRADKVFSHNIYLCPGWDRTWGGQLALYAGALDTEPARTVHPEAGNSVLFARSNSSWHEVLPVSPQAARPRRAVLVHGHHAAGLDGSPAERTAIVPGND